MILTEFQIVDLRWLATLFPTPLIQTLLQKGPLGVLDSRSRLFGLQFTAEKVCAPWLVLQEIRSAF